MKIKTKTERLALLKKWRQLYRDSNAAWEQVQKIFPDTTNCDLWDATWGLFDAYTDLVAEAVGDDGESLDWYCYENDMGKKGMAAGVDGQMRHIKSLKDLLWVIDAGRERKE